jgi:hypothetical protein
MKQETIEEAALNIIPDKSTAGWIDSFGATERIGFIKGVKWQQEKMYSEDEVIELLQKYRYDLSSGKTANIGDTTKFWFIKHKKK